MSEPFDPTGPLDPAADLPTGPVDAGGPGFTEPPTAPQVPAAPSSAPREDDPTWSSAAADHGPGAEGEAVAPSTGGSRGGAGGAGSDGGRAARRRAAEQAAREAAAVSRRRALILSGSVLAMLVLVGVVVGGWSLLHRTPAPSPTSEPSPTPTASGPAQPTLLIQVKTTDGVAVDTVLTSVLGSVKTANVITMPSTLLLDPATGGTLPLGQIARLPDVNASGDALSDAMGVDVDGTWAMDTLAFSGLVDAVGGVVVDVDANVYVTQPDGKEVILVAAGPQKLLEGPQAAAYATYLAPGEDEAARMARYSKVLSATLAKLPADPSKVEAIVTALGASAKSSLPVSQLSTYLVRMRSDLGSSNVAYSTLPVTEIAGAQDGTTAYRLDQKATAELVDKVLPDAKRVPGPNSKVRVLVQNGVGTPGLNAAARQALVDAGFTYVNGGNAATFGHPVTQILVPDASTESLQWGKDIAAALKVPAADVVVASDPQSLADVYVVLGADFKPAS